MRNKFEDSYLYQGRRKALCEKLAEKGIKDENVLQAIGKLPRHFFLDSAFERHAYEDKPFSIGEGQTISQPYTVAYQSELLQIKPGDKVLEIGTGSGYQAAILQLMGAEVYTIEYNQNLFKKTKKLLDELKIGKKMHLFYGDGSNGLEEFSPYDKIIVTAGATESIPEPLINQLNKNGVLIIPSGDQETQKMLRVTKKNGNKTKIETFENFCFVPLLGEFGWK